MSRAELFNRKASSPKSRPDEVMKALALRRGDSVADIGSGGGYFTLRFAKAVGPSGKIYAVDTDQELLSHIEKKAVEEGHHNISTLLSAGDSFDLPEKSLDLIFMRNVSHHLAGRTEYFARLKRLLKPSGKVSIIEYDARGRFSLRKLTGHYVPKETIIREMTEAGYRLLENVDLLPEQSFLTFGQTSGGEGEDTCKKASLQSAPPHQQEV